MRPTVTAARLSGGRASLFPYDYWHDRYQEHYREGLRRYFVKQGGVLEVASPRFPPILDKLRQVRHSARAHRILGRVIPATNVLLDGLAWSLGARPPSPNSSAGRYSLRVENSREFRVCIDSH